MSDEIMFSWKFRATYVFPLNIALSADCVLVSRAK